MKNARTLAVLILAMVANAAIVRADAPHDVMEFDPAAEPPDMSDPNFVPDVFKNPPKPDPTPEQIAAVEEAEKKEAENKNWLLRGYEQQLQSRQAEPTNGAPAEGTDLLATLSSDKDLAKAAGIEPLDVTSTPELNPLTGEDGQKPKVDLRSDPSLDDPLASANSKSASLFKPLITPLESPGTAQVDAPYAMPSPVTSSVFSPLSFDLAPGETAEDDAAGNVAPEDPSAMDVPGMTAAESNPAMREALDLPNDPEPGALPPEEKPHHDLLLELPVASNSDRLDKLQNSALAIPGQLPSKKSAPVTITPYVFKPPGDTDQMVPVPPPLRSHVADPYDILR